MKTEAEIKERLKSLDNSEDWPSATELLEWVLDPSPVVHEGKEKARCEHTHPGWLNREKVFADRWNETNNPRAVLNSGRGTLTWLLCMERARHPLTDQDIIVQGRHLTQEEATAAASAIQWLGTNCGWCWLEECIRACGFDIVTKRTPK